MDTAGTNDDGRELDAAVARLDAHGARLGRGRRRRAARRLASVRSAEATSALARAYAAGDDEEVTATAAAALAGLSDQAAIDAVCEAVIATGDDRLAALAAEADYRHSDPTRRALQLFLTGQFDDYAELDFDGSLLAAAHLAAGEPVRDRLMRRARASARMDWVRALVGVRRADRLGNLSDQEWEAVVGTLCAANRWEELWRLAALAPPMWGLRMLRELGDRRWRPADPAERVGFEELTGLAKACSGDPMSGLLADEPVRLEAPGSGVMALSVTADGGSLVAGTNRGRLGFWRLPSGASAGQAPTPDLDGRVNDLVALPDAGRVACASARAVTLWPARTEPATELRPPGDDSPGGAVELALAPDGRLLVGAGAQGALVWRTPWRQPPRMVPHGEPLRHVTVSATGCLAGVGNRDGTVLLWRLPDGAPIAAMAGHRGPVHCLAVTPDGGLLASGGRDGSIRLWRLPSGEAAGVIAAERSSVMHLAVSPDGRLLASAGGEGSVRLWRLPSGEPAGVLDGHKGWVSYLAVAPDGRLLASGGSDQTVRLWRLPSGQPAGVLSGHTGIGIVSSMVFSPDGSLLTSASNKDSTVLLWRLWPSVLRTASRTPVGDVAPSGIEELAAATPERPGQVRDWALAVAALVRWRRRHDIGIDVGTVGDEHVADTTDIEVDRCTDPRRSG